jgi:serine/threonine protein kinase
MDRYRKGGVLGEGTYGKVVQAEEIATGKVVAIKKVLKIPPPPASGLPCSFAAAVGPSRGFERGPHVRSSPCERSRVVRYLRGSLTWPDLRGRFRGDVR